MIEKNDWRITNQMDYLKSKKLVNIHYDREIMGDHEHCEFCWDKFMYNTDIGYCSIDLSYWICPECYEDFKDMFEWELVNNNYHHKK